MNARIHSQPKTECFDIESDMAVYTADGEKIGTVMQIAGFGSTKIRRAGDHGTAELVIQAKTGSGYFNIDRTEVQGIRAAAPLCVPFRGIQDVVPERGVILNDTILDELHHQRDPRPIKAMITPATRRRWWPKWLL